MFHRGWFQIVMADRALRGQVCSVLGQYGTARVHCEEGQHWPEPASIGRYAGIVCEWTSDAAARLQELRAMAPCLPVLMFTPPNQLARFNQLQAASVEVALLPVHIGQLTAFAQRALAACFLPHERVSRMVAFLAQSRGLTAREVQLLSYCLGDEPRARVRRRLGISENTLKTQVKALLRKCGERNVDALAKNVLRAALLETAPQARVAEPVAPWYPSRGAA